VMSKSYWQIINLLPISFRKLLGSGIGLLSHQKLKKLINLLLNLSRQKNFEDKIFKSLRALEAKSFDDLYYILCSNWQNPSEVVIDAKEPGTLLTQFKPELGKIDNQQKMMVLDFLTYLPDDILVKVDRSAMASSLETRAPFLDHKLIEYVWRIPQSYKLRNGHGKWILKKILGQYVPNNLIDRPKMGFGVPIENWLRGPIKDWAENLLNEKKLKQDGIFNSKIIRDKWQDHLSGKKNWHHDLWNILMFQSWINEKK